MAGWVDALVWGLSGLKSAYVWWQDELMPWYGAWVVLRVHMCGGRMSWCPGMQSWCTTGSGSVPSEGRCRPPSMKHRNSAPALSASNSTRWATFAAFCFDEERRLCTTLAGTLSVQKFCKLSDQHPWLSVAVAHHQHVALISSRPGLWCCLKHTMMQQFPLLLADWSFLAVSVYRYYVKMRALKRQHARVLEHCLHVYPLPCLSDLWCHAGQCHCGRPEVTVQPVRREDCIFRGWRGTLWPEGCCRFHQVAGTAAANARRKPGAVGVFWSECPQPEMAGLVAATWETSESCLEPTCQLAWFSYRRCGLSAFGTNQKQYMSHAPVARKAVLTRRLVGLGGLRNASFGH